MNVWSQWSSDILTLIATYISVEVLAAQTCVRSFMMMSGMLPIGVAEATCTLVGNNVGAGLPELAKKLYKTAFIICWSLAAATIILMILAKDQIIGIFTTQDKIISLISDAWPLLLIYCFGFVT